MNDTSNIKNLITVKQAAVILNVSRQTIYNQIKQGTAPGHERVAGKLLFHKDAVLQRKRQNTRKGVPAGTGPANQGDHSCSTDDSSRS
jgi:excisionase family DNA binding protein